MNNTIKIDESRCTGCGTCVRECQQHLPVHSVINPVLDGMECIKCLHCFAVCPQGAISVGFSDPFVTDDWPGRCGVELEDGFSGEIRGTGAETSHLFNLIARRRSCRKFKKKRIDNNMVRKLAQAAAYVPSGGNSHAHRVTVLTEGETRRQLDNKLREIYRKRRILLGNAFLRYFGILFSNKQMSAFLRDRIYLKRITFLLGRFDIGEDPIFYNAPVVMFVHSREIIPTPQEDSIIAVYNIVLAAETMGLGTCIVSLAQNAINSSRALKKTLYMGPKEQVHAVVVAGYPAVNFKRVIPRQPIPLAWIDGGSR